MTKFCLLRGTSAGNPASTLPPAPGGTDQNLALRRREVALGAPSCTGAHWLAPERWSSAEEQGSCPEEQAADRPCLPAFWAPWSEKTTLPQVSSFLLMLRDHDIA